MSRKIKERTKQLATREQEIKKQLLGSSGKSKSKVQKAGQTALVGGLAAFLLYAFYKAFFQDDVKRKKNKSGGRSTSGIVVEKLFMFLLPYLGEFLEDFLKKRSRESKKEEVVEKEG